MVTANPAPKSRPRQGIGKAQEAQEADFFRHRREAGKRGAAQAITRAQKVQAQQRIGGQLGFATEIDQAVAFVQFTAKPDGNRGEEQDELGLGTQQPWQRGEAQPPD